MTKINGLPDSAPDTLIAIEKADIAVAEAAAAITHDPMIAALGEASEVADQPPLIGITLVVLVAGLALRRQRMATAGARMLAAHLIATGIKTAVKRSVDRTRPHVLTEEDRYEVREARSTHPRYNSFPSGHTAGAVAVAEGLARTVPQATWPVRLWAASIAAIQIPRRKHYVSDVAAGAMVGIVADRAVRLVERIGRHWLRR